MAFYFDPTFSLLPKFSLGFRPVPTTEEEVKRVSRYLGVDLPPDDVEENARRLTSELESQNGFLTYNLESKSIHLTDEYHRSKFIRDIVANNRDNREMHNGSPEAKPVGFYFDPAFALLPKFTVGLRPMPTSEEDVKRVSEYLGVVPTAAGLDEKIKTLISELESQNGYLAKHLESDAVFESDAYRRSKFTRDIVANNRDSRARRVSRSDRPGDGGSAEGRYSN